MSDNKNVLLAVVLSIVVLIGWQVFVIGPMVEEDRQRQAALEAQQAAEQQTPGEAAPNLPTPESRAGTGLTAPGGTIPAGQAGATPEDVRIPILTDRVEGSVNLVGGRIDDLRLMRYHDTVDPESPKVRLLSPAGTDKSYFAEFGWLSDGAGEVPTPDTNTVWTARSQGSLSQDNSLVLEWDNGAGLIFTRTYEIDDAYLFSITQSVENASGQVVVLHPYGRVTRRGKPQTTNFWILHEGLLGVFGEEGFQTATYGDLEENQIQSYDQTTSGWLGITDKYWATALVPPSGATFSPRFTSANSGLVPTFQADYMSDAVTVADGSSEEVTARLFAGAKQVKLIDGYEAQFGIDRFELMIDWGWFYFITKPLFYTIDFLYGILGNFGLAILAVTVFIKLVFFPLANKSYKSMTMMKKVQPQVMELRDRYKDDKQKQQQAMMELYKKEKINPLSGCLPILIQIPVFFALYKVLFVTIDMRHAPFYGWVQDLSAPDPTTLFNLFGLIPWTPPEWIPLLGVWPIIMGITMFVQMKMNPAPTDATQAMIFNWMPVLFTIMLASFPAGLVIYWAWNNLLSILQQGVIMRRYGVKIELIDNIKGMFSKKQDKPAE
ncbi:MAG: membrane protein insertase YidC [Pseudomonadota bacterium]